MSELPHRPRLADAALLRRHRVDGVDRWMLHDTQRHEALELTAEQVEQCLACDGTRDVGGILLAAARSGAYRRASDVIALLADLMQRGLLVDGTEPPHPLDTPVQMAAEIADRPLVVLPNYRLRCTGQGSCCQTYGSIPFSAAERRRADAAVPEVAETLGRHRFLPLHGAEPAELRAVATIDGACAFLDRSGCRVHARAGLTAKPRACQAFPAQLVDDGEVVRVSVAVECACVLASLDEAEGSPLVPPDVHLAGLLPAGTRVPSLAQEVAVRPTVKTTRAALRAFTTVTLDALTDDTDGLGFAWSLAHRIERDGLGAASTFGASSHRQPAPDELAPWLDALHRQLSQKREHAKWRSPNDRSRRRADWLCDVAASLLDPSVVASTLEHCDDHRAEAFTLRACLWGYRLLSPNLVAALRDRAVRFLLARRCRAVAPDPDEPARNHPIAAVEAMMRGQGIEAYVNHVNHETLAEL